MKMKKMCCSILVFLFVISAVGAAGAATIGAPGIPPGQGRFSFGLEYISVRGRNLSDENFEPRAVDTEALHYLGTVKYGLSERLTLFGRAGSSDLTIYGQELYPHSSDMGWGGGFNFVLLEDLSMNLKMLGGAQYYTYEPDPAEGRSFDWQEWDASMAVLIVNRIDARRPLIEPFALTQTSFYAGGRYSDARVDWTRGADSGTLKAEDNLGYFVGIDLVFNDNYAFSLEGRFRDERAYTAAISFKF